MRTQQASSFEQTGVEPTKLYKLSIFLRRVTQPSYTVGLYVPSRVLVTKMVARFVS